MSELASGHPQKKADCVVGKGAIMAKGDFWKSFVGHAVWPRICAVHPAGYVVDNERPGVRAGLQITSTGGDNYHSESWDGDCFVIYSAGNNHRGSNPWARGIRVVAIKKLHPESLCGKAEKRGTQLLDLGVTQIQMDAAAVDQPS